MKKIITTNDAPAPIGPYNQAVEVHGMLFISGQIALVPGTDTITMDTVENETTQVMKNLEAILHEAGLTFDHVVKTSIFLSDMKLFAQVNAVYANYFRFAERSKCRNFGDCSKILILLFFFEKLKNKMFTFIS